MDEEKSLKEVISELNETLKETKIAKEKKKSFSLPFGARVGKAKVKKGWATYMVIRENRNVDFIKKPIEQQTVVIDDVPRIATPDEMLSYKGKPFVILPSWSVKPFSPTDNYDATIKNGYASQGYKLLLSRMKSEIVDGKKKISGSLIWIIIAVVVGGFFLMKSGMFK
jgi:hypothetical protein